MKRAARWILVAALLAPPAWLTVLLAPHAVDLPFWDQWELVPLLEKDAARQVALSDLAWGHNEHRPLFPRLLMLGMARSTGWNIRVEIAANVVLAGVALLGLVLLVHRSGVRGTWLLSLSVLLSLLTFNPSQSENWVWGWQLMVFLHLVGVVWSLVLLSPRAEREPPLRAVGIAAALAFVATFSYASAFMLWPAAMPILLVRTQARGRAIALWLTAAVATSLLYFSSYDLPPRSGAALSITRYVGYLLRMLGAPLTLGQRELAPAVSVSALALVLLFTLIAWRRLPRPQVSVPSLSLVIYGLLAALLVSTGRHHEGYAQAFASRYVTITTMLFSGLAALVWLVTCARPNAGGRLLAAAFGTVVVFGAFGAGRVGARVIVEQAIGMKAMRAAIITGQLLPEQEAALYPDRQSLYERIAILRRLRLSVFRSSPAGRLTDP